MGSSRGPGGMQQRSGWGAAEVLVGSSRGPDGVQQGSWWGAADVRLGCSRGPGGVQQGSGWIQPRSRSLLPTNVLSFFLQKTKRGLRLRTNNRFPESLFLIIYDAFGVRP